MSEKLISIHKAFSEQKIREVKLKEIIEYLKKEYHISHITYDESYYIRYWISGNSESVIAKLDQIKSIHIRQRALRIQINKMNPGIDANSIPKNMLLSILGITNNINIETKINGEDFKVNIKVEVL